MTETLLAFVALMLVVAFSMSQQRVIVKAEQEIAGIELEVLAHAVGSDMMQQIAAKDFDSAVGGASSVDIELSDLTLTSAFGSGNKCPNVCGDIDDYNAMQADTVFFEIKKDDLGNPVGFDFVVEAAVHYVDDAGQATTDRTWVKEVILQIDLVSPSDEYSYLIRPIIMQHQFSPQW